MAILKGPNFVKGFVIHFLFLDFVWRFRVCDIFVTICWLVGEEETRVDFCTTRLYYYSAPLSLQSILPSCQPKWVNPNLALKFFIAQNYIQFNFFSFSVMECNLWSVWKRKLCWRTGNFFREMEIMVIMELLVPKNHYGNNHQVQFYFIITVVNIIIITITTTITIIMTTLVIVGAVHKLCQQNRGRRGLVKIWQFLARGRSLRLTSTVLFFIM